MPRSTSSQNKKRTIENIQKFRRLNKENTNGKKNKKTNYMIIGMNRDDRDIDMKDIRRV